MAAQPAKTFVVIFPNYWGKSDSIEKAVKQARMAGHSSKKKVDAHVLALACDSEKVVVESFVDCAVRYPTDTVALKWRQKL